MSRLSVVHPVRQTRHHNGGIAIMRDGNSVNVTAQTEGLGGISTHRQFH